MMDSGTAIRRSFERVRFEIIPMRGVEAQIQHLPRNATVTVTSSPSKGLDATLALAETLQRTGSFTVVPHLAARLVADPAHLRAVLQQLDDLGIREAFVVAGDARTPAGAFEGAVDLLRAMDELGHNLREIGITGYPESHAIINDKTTIQAMFAKEPYASYIVSQICFDPAVTLWWIDAVRARGTQLPIYVGLPGAVDFSRLMRISLRVGLGDSLRYLRKQARTVTKLAGGYKPNHLVERLAPRLADPPSNVAGWHLFTFNEVNRTERWRQEMLARYRRKTS